MLVEEVIAHGLREANDVDTSLPSGAMPHDECAAERPIANASVFKKNDIYLEVCGQFEAQRGMLGFAACLIPVAMIVGTAHLLVAFPLRDLINLILGETYAENPAGWGETIFGVTFMSLMLWGLLWLFKKLALPIARKDYFTTRRTLIRFNRVTRKVYIHHPPSAGGIQTFDWDEADATLDDADPSQSGGRLILGWTDMQAAKVRGLVFVGRAAGNAARGRAWWEYIRRYMEDGPDSVPKPFPRLWKGVWPQMSLLNIFYPYPERLLHGGPLWWLLLPCLAPFDLMRAALHWLAMLLCVEPKFPPEIEQAGQGMPANMHTQNT